ncbi:MAG: tetratricopeptide repeat protein [bacterium]|nr:tetratricopeptide repeat protein [bacterium]
MVTNRHIGGIARVLILCLCVFAATTTSLFAQTDAAKAAYNEGQTAKQAKNYDAAVAAYKKAIEADASYYDAYLNLGVVYFATEKYDDAVQNFKLATEKKPDNTEAFVNLAKVQSVLKRYPESIQAFEGAVKNSATLADSAAMMLEIAKVQGKAGDQPAVIATIEKIHTWNAATDETWYALGKAYEREKNTKSAMNAYEQSLALKADNAQAHFAIGNLHLQAEKYALAAEQFKSALQDDPKNYKAAYNYAFATETLNPDSIDVHLTNWQEYIRLAKNQPKAQDDVAIATQHVKELQAAKAAKAGN